MPELGFLISSLRQVYKIVESRLLILVLFEHVFIQQKVSRLKYYGSLPVQTIQNPGDVIYVPSDSGFAYYNVGGPIVELVEKITAIDSIDILQDVKSFCSK